MPETTTERTDKPITVNVKFSGEDAALIRAEAARTGTARGQLVRDYTMDFIRLRDEHAAMVARPDAEQDGHLVHTILQQMEARQAATMERIEDKVDRQHAELTLQMATIDALAKLLFQRLPTPPDDEAAGWTSDAIYRYQKWAEAIPDGLDGGEARLLAALRRQLEEEAGE